MGDKKYPLFLKTLISHCNYLSLQLVIVNATDPGHPIVDVNEEFEKLTGYSKEEVLGKNPRFLQGNGTEKESLSQFKEDIREGKKSSAYVLNYKKDGSPFWNHFNAIPIYGEKGNVLYIAGIMHDVSAIVENVKSQSEVNSMVALVHRVCDIVSDYMNYLQLFRTYLDEETSIPKEMLQEFDANYYYLLEDIKHLNKTESFNEIIEWNDSFFSKALKNY